MNSALVAVSVSLIAGCHASFTTSAPKGFVELEQHGVYDFRATSADGVVLAVRELDNDPEAELDFWARAVENAMRQRGGYALLQRRNTAVAGGVPAQQLRFGHDEANRPHLYYATVVVAGSTLYLLEAGGSKPLVEQQAKQIDAFIQRFRAERCAPFPVWFLCSAVTGSGPARAPAPAPAAAPAATPAPASPAAPPPAETKAK
jgi:hypothetical protein